MCVYANFLLNSEIMYRRTVETETNSSYAYKNAHLFFVRLLLWGVEPNRQ